MEILGRSTGRLWLLGLAGLVLASCSERSPDPGVDGGSPLAQEPEPTPWQAKVSSDILDRLDVLEANGVLEPGQEYRAPEFATDTVQIDEQARLRVESRVDAAKTFDARYFESIGGELVASAAGPGYVVAWIPALRLPEFAGRDDVQLVFGIAPPYTDDPPR
jgi:hypothetical protein